MKPQAGLMISVELDVLDVERSKTFLVESLGFTVGASNDRSAELKLGDWYQLVLTERPGSVNAQLALIVVRDVREEHRRLRDSGVSVSDLAEDSGAASFTLEDPDGNTLQYLENRSEY
jgi:catechol 2,3-dioxygenase-like lactoylglutathione lyase family enzyme